MLHFRLKTNLTRSNGLKSEIIKLHQIYEQSRISIGRKSVSSLSVQMHQQKNIIIRKCTKIVGVAPFKHLFVFKFSLKLESIQTYDAMRYVDYSDNLLQLEVIIKSYLLVTTASVHFIFNFPTSTSHKTTEKSEFYFLQRPWREQFQI